MTFNVSPSSIRLPLVSNTGSLEDPILAAKISEVAAEALRLNFAGFDVNFSVNGLRVYLQFQNSEIKNLNLEIHNRVFSGHILDSWISSLESLHKDSGFTVGA